jgi:hypothetical protein
MHAQLASFFIPFGLFLHIFFYFNQEIKLSRMYEFPGVESLLLEPLSGVVASLVCVEHYHSITNKVFCHRNQFYIFELYLVRNCFYICWYSFLLSNYIASCLVVQKKMFLRIFLHLFFLFL